MFKLSDEKVKKLNEILNEIPEKINVQGLEVAYVNACPCGGTCAGSCIDNCTKSNANCFFYK